jgi:hypothetical protein
MLHVRARSGRARLATLDALMMPVPPLTARRPTRLAAAFALCAAAAVGCGRDDSPPDAGADSSLARDLTLASEPTRVTPNFVPADTPADSAVATPAPSPTEPERRATPRAPRASARAPSRSRTPTRVAERPRPTPAPPATPESAAAAPATAAAPTSVPAPSPSDASAPGPHPSALPAGTSVALATNQQVCTGTNRVGDKLTATVSESVSGASGVVIPSGAKVVLEIDSIARGRKPEDTRITFHVRAVVDGTRTIPVTGEASASDELETTRTTTKGSDAKKVAGGAIIGAILGQVIGKDTKGTMIGGAVGAAAGAAAAKVTERYEGCLPEGAALKLTVAGPVS